MIAELQQRAKRLLAREDFQKNPLKAVLARLSTKAAAKLGAKDFQTKLDEDISVSAPYSSSPGKAIRYHGVSEPETMATFRRLLLPGGVFVDVGAHIGEYSLIAAKDMGPQATIIALEPGRDILPYLEANVANSRFADQISVIPSAVSDFTGTTIFKLGADPGHSRISSGNADGSQLPTVGEIEVDVVRLDELLVEKSILPHVVKIDVEGADAQVIYGLGSLLAPVAEPRPAILFEYLPRTWTVFGNDFDDLVRFLEGFGYKLFSVEGEVISRVRSKADADRATAGLDLDLVAMLPEHITRCQFKLSDELSA